MRRVTQAMREIQIWVGRREALETRNNPVGIDTYYTDSEES